MFLRRLLSFLIAVGSAAVFTFTCLCLRAQNVSRFLGIVGEHTFYLRSCSSQALMKTRLNVLDAFLVKGESVRRVMEKGKPPRQIAKELAEYFGAEILIEEDACGVRSFYGYTPAWRECVYVNGVAVNLHIAIEENRLTVGSPIIFGGF